MLVILFLSTLSVAQKTYLQEAEVFTPSFNAFLKSLPKKQNRDPIVLVPGLAGSRLEKTSSSTPKNDWSTLWLDLGRTLPFFKNKYIQELTTAYDVTTDTFSSQPGMQTRPYKYSRVEGVTCLDPSLCSQTIVMKGLVEGLIQSGYTDGQDLFAAPFDFRLAGCQQAPKNGMFADLKTLIEQASTKNNGKKVHILSHSAGGVFVNHFLTSFVSQQWKDQYVASFIPTSGPFGGTKITAGFIIFKDKWVIPTLNAEDSYKVASGLALGYWLFPSPQAFNPDDVIVSLPQQSTVYTVRNLSQAFSDTGRPTLSLIAQRQAECAEKARGAPRVPVHVIYGTGLGTGSRYESQSTTVKWWEETHTTVTSDGDDTVNIESLRYPSTWKSMQTQPIDITEIKGQHHSAIVNNADYIQRIIGIISRD